MQDRTKDIYTEWWWSEGEKERQSGSYRVRTSLRVRSPGKLRGESMDIDWNFWTQSFAQVHTGVYQSVVPYMATVYVRPTNDDNQQALHGTVDLTLKRNSKYANESNEPLNLNFTARNSPPK